MRQPATGRRRARVHECATVLGRELGIAPGTATLRLHEAIVRAGGSVPAADVAPTPPLTAIVGRERVWAQLTRYWQQAEAGRAQFVVVTGEPGIGKTRLIEELATRCGQGETVVCRARSYLTEGELGWGALATWLRTPEVAARVRRSTPSDLVQLSRIVPELCPPVALRAGGGIPGDRADGVDGAERRRIFDAAASVKMGACAFGHSGRSRSRAWLFGTSGAGRADYS